MTWEVFYFVCFLVGFLFSLVSVLAGSSHFHLPRSFHVGAGHGTGPGGVAHHSPINFGTIAAFLAWFGGTGYLLTRYSSLWALLALTLALISGLGGAAAVFWFLVKVLLAHEQKLEPADFEMVGVLGHVSSTLRLNGTGEMIYSQNGTRRAVSIRSETGESIAKGVEVVVTRCEKGIAYVRRWEDLSEPKNADSMDA